MEIELLLDSSVQAFIQKHKEDKPQDVAFKAHGKFDFPVGFLVDQIAGPKKSIKKLPSWQKEGIIFPPDISLQQCSSEETARYKAGLVRADSVLDLTGGFGVDVHAFAQQSKRVVHIEQNEWLSKVVSHNFQALSQNNVECVNATAEAYLDKSEDAFDLIYIDPARRDKGGGKVFKFADCVPNVVELKDQLMVKSNQLLVKASPMIDITQGVRELGNVAKVWVIGLKNECKEVLFLVEKAYEGKVEVVGVELRSDKTHTLRKVDDHTFDYIDAVNDDLKFIYDPYTVLHKIGNYSAYLPAGINQIAPNTNLFASEVLVEDFPGRTFLVKGVVKYNKKEVQKLLGGKKANIFTRNFSDKPEGMKKKLGLQDGGDQYVIGFRDQNMKPLIAVCSLEKQS